MTASTLVFSVRSGECFHSGVLASCLRMFCEMNNNELPTFTSFLILSSCACSLSKSCFALTIEACCSIHCSFSSFLLLASLPILNLGFVIVYVVHQFISMCYDYFNTLFIPLCGCVVRIGGQYRQNDIKNLLVDVSHELK